MGPSQHLGASHLLFSLLPFVYVSVSSHAQDVYIHGHDHVGQHSEVDGVVHLGNGVGGYGNHPATANNRTVWVE